MAPIQHDAAVIRDRLAAERAGAAARAAELTASIGAVVAATEGANSDDEHDPEGATIAFERAQAQALLRLTETHLAEIDAALARLAAGRYGECASCGAPIPAARLEARPTALTCVSCATRPR
jgi:RNA polymerase-binding transcription factor DksA